METSFYHKVVNKGKEKKIIETLYKKLEKCDICPHNCGVNRIKGEKGICNSGLKIKISSYFPHHGEEPPISGIYGSGTIFFSSCNLKCIFCQNYELSAYETGSECSTEELSEIMNYLQKLKCHNVNLVTPTHFLPQIIEAISIARHKGLTIPIVYNTSGYEKKETLEIIDGFIDIYMPDFKFFTDKVAQKYTNAHDYAKHAKVAILEMYRQVGPLISDSMGIAQRGLLIRHLIMPGHTDESLKIIEFLAKNLPQKTYLNLMSQYRPEYLANKYPEISRPITDWEYNRVIQYAKKLGFFVND
ncbi:MAG: radical SAM protein [Candidatus Marinimicrobia bacterium]|nr:radical SAM protein [Candidatus Neomarinimicrobiota bacterium]